MDIDMTVHIIELKKLIASEGTILTNGSAYGTEIYLGKNDSAENWHEITDAEYEAILKEQGLTESEVLDIE